MSLILCLLIICLLTSRAGVQNENPAQRYMNAYKKYLGAPCPLEPDSIRHFIYFARDRESICNHPFLKVPRIAGAQIMYAWKELEKERGKYNFEKIRTDYEYLGAHGKKLFIQLQDASFNPAYPALPEYLNTEEFDGGSALQVKDDGTTEGWVAKRWNPKVQHRFALLLDALGSEFDGKVEGVNLQETAIGVNGNTDTTFTPEKYVQGLKTNMRALKKAFPQSVTMQYANFMPGEWLPWDDKGYLRSVYLFGQEIGVGLGAPDLMFKRKAQLNHSLAMMHENDFTVPLGIAVQDGNYTGKTGADPDYEQANPTEPAERENMVPLLHAFAKNFLKVRYLFWVNQEPYFAEDLLPCLDTY